ncbi:MAG: hypothetical protein RI907_2939 [Pseudomonadota bacterium]|jgi:mono/diheme cytochrome c family protein
MTSLTFRSTFSLCALALLCMAAPACGQTVEEGEAIFKTRCFVCHGVNADGKSDLARIMRPPPANLRASRLTDEERATIVRKGGAAVGRSSNMPVWEQELNEHELLAVLSYVRSIKGTAQ